MANMPIDYGFKCVLFSIGLGVLTDINVSLNISDQK
jgi:hypothetical protein